MTDKTTTESTNAPADGTLLNNSASPTGQEQVAASAAPSTLNLNDWFTSEGQFMKGVSGRLPEDLKEHAATVQKFEGVPFTDVLKSYGSLQRKLGERLQMPGDDSKPEQVAAWRKITGTPEKPEGYEICRPEDVPKEMWNDGLAKGFAELAHKHHMSPAAAKEIVGWWNAQQKGAWESAQGQAQSMQEEAVANLRTEWRDRFADNLHSARRVALISNLDPNDPAIGNNPTVIRVLHAMSALISDDHEIRSNSTGPRLSPTQEADDIQTNPANAWYADYQGKHGADRQKAAADRVLKLRMSAVG